MNTARTIMGWGMVIALLLGTTAAGEPVWRKVAEFKTGGMAKEVALSAAPIHRVMIRCVEGSVIVNTITIRGNGSREPIAVARQLRVNEEYILELNAAHPVVGLRISDAAHGRYEVYVSP